MHIVRSILIAAIETKKAYTHAPSTPRTAHPKRLSEASVVTIVIYTKPIVIVTYYPFLGVSVVIGRVIDIVIY